MNEEEWLVCTDPWRMLEFLERRASARKLRLFAVACCRRARHLSDDPRLLGAVEAAERTADGDLNAPEFAEAMRPVRELWARVLEWERGPFRYMASAARHLTTPEAAKYAAGFAARGLACLKGEEEGPDWIAALGAEEVIQSELLRDIFGDPSRPLRIDPDWLTGQGHSAARLARRIEEEGRFGDLPTLAESLERAGCRERAMVDHCRTRGPHVRGCWVLDALLGRESAVHSGLITEADWRACQDPTSLLHFLQDKGSNRPWRLFALACCRRIDHWIQDERSRRAIEVAARFADGDATEGALEEARTTAQQAQEEAKDAEWSAEAEANFCMTPKYAAVSRDLFATKAARSAVCRDPRVTDDEPGTFEAKYWAPSSRWAVATAHWAAYAGGSDQVTAPRKDLDDSVIEWPTMTEHGKLISITADARIEKAAQDASTEELRVQCVVLNDLFGEYLGPPGDAGAWLPCGDAAPVKEWWCRLPTRRSLVHRPEWLEWTQGPIPKLAESIRAEEAYDRLPSLADALERAGCHEPAILEHLRGGGPHFQGCWVLEFLSGRNHSLVSHGGISADNSTG